MTRWIGRWLMGVGVVHVMFGFVVFSEPLMGIVRDGMWNAVDGYAGRPLAFWFVFLGLFTILFGSIVDRVELYRMPIPRLWGWAFAVLVALGVVTMPIGGGWLLVPPAVGVIVRAHRRAGTEAVI